MAGVELSAEAQRFAELRQAYIGALLLHAQRVTRERSIGKLRRMGHSGLTLAHTNLLAHLEGRGTRITTLAERAGISKQAMGYLVIDLENKGYIRREVDPKDKRATLITFTEGGQKFLEDSIQVKLEVEAEYGALLGQEDFQTLKALLGRLIEVAELPKGDAETEGEQES